MTAKFIKPQNFAIAKARELKFTVLQINFMMYFVIFSKAYFLKLFRDFISAKIPSLNP